MTTMDEFMTTMDAFMMTTMDEFMMTTMDEFRMRGNCLFC
jgi:hypothetical protein